MATANFRNMEACPLMGAFDYERSEFVDRPDADPADIYAMYTEPGLKCRDTDRSAR
jgi:hypothetical protein